MAEAVENCAEEIKAKLPEVSTGASIALSTPLEAEIIASVDNLLPKYTGSAVTKNGITFTPKPDGSIALSGTSTTNYANLQIGTISRSSTLLCELSGGISENVSLVLILNNSVSAADVGAGVTTYVFKNREYIVSISIKPSTCVDGLVIHPVLSADLCRDIEIIGTNINIEREYSFDENLLCVYGANQRTKNGVTFTPNFDGTITLSGTASAYTEFNIQNVMPLPLGKYFLSGGISSKIRLGLSDQILDLCDEDVGSGSQLTIESNVESEDLEFVVRVDQGTIINQKTMAPMLAKSCVTPNYKSFAKISGVSKIFVIWNGNEGKIIWLGRIWNIYSNGDGVKSITLPSGLSYKQLKNTFT